jgi:hypothetical protein
MGLAVTLIQAVECAAFRAPKFKPDALGWVSPPLPPAAVFGSLALMGFLLRSAFWLGLTFHAMPWGETRLTDAVPAAQNLAVGVATQARDEAVSAAARAVLRAALEPRPAGAVDAPTRPAPSLKTKRASLDTLSAGDRLAPWRGAGARSAL